MSKRKYRISQFKKISSDILDLEKYRRERDGQNERDFRSQEERAEVTTLQEIPEDEEAEVVSFQELLEDGKDEGFVSFYLLNTTDEGLQSSDLSRRLREHFIGSPDGVMMVKESDSIILIHIKRSIAMSFLEDPTVSTGESIFKFLKEEDPKTGERIHKRGVHWQSQLITINNIIEGL